MEISRREFMKYSLAMTATLLGAGCIAQQERTAIKPTPEAPTNKEVKEIVIGSNHPLTGVLSYEGKRMHAAIELAAKKKNDSGGVKSLGGAKIKVIAGDNQGKQELGGQVTDELIDKGAVIVLGCYSSPVTMSATEVAEKRKVPFIVSVSVADEVLQGRGLKYVYRPQPPAMVMARDFAKMVPEIIRNSDKDVKTAGLFYINNKFGQSIRNHLLKFLPENDVEIIEEVSYEYGASSVDTQVLKLKNANPDMIIATTYVSGGILLAKSMMKLGYRSPYLTTCAAATYVNEDAVQQVGEFANGVLSTNYALNPRNPKTQTVKKEFKELTGMDLSATAGMAYVAAEVAIKALEEAGSTDPEVINSTLRKIKVTDHIAAMPPIEFGEDGENKNALAPVLQVQDLRVKVVYPPEFAEAEPVV